MWRFSILGLAFVAAVAFVWWLDPGVADPTPDRSLETASARRARLTALLDREVRVEFENEPVSQLIERLCAAADVRVRILDDEETLSAPAPNGRGPHNPARLHLPHPIRLRSALALAAPTVTASLVGEELHVCARRGKQKLPRALRVRSLLFAPNALAPISPDDAVTSPTLLLEMGMSPSRARDPFDQLMGLFALPIPDQFGVWLAAEPVSFGEQFVDGLESAAAEDLPEPVLLGESVAGRVRRLQAQADLDRVIDLNLEQVLPQQAAANIQEQLGVSLYVQPWSVSEGSGELHRLSLVGRAPARLALRFILGPESYVQPLHDVVMLSEKNDSVRLWMYPIGRLVEADGSSTLECIDPHLLRTDEIRISRRAPQAFQRQALVAYQTPTGHARVQELLELLNQGQLPKRSAAKPDPVRQALDRPARPMPGPLTLDELARRLIADHDICVLAYESHDEAGERVTLPGDAGAGTVEAQLTRMMHGVGGEMIVCNGALLLSADDTGEHWSVQLVGGAQFEPYGAQSLQVGPVGALRSLLGMDRETVTVTTSESHESYASVAGGELVWAQAPFQQLAARLLAAGHPFHATWMRCVSGPRAAREQVLAQAISHPDPHVSGLGVWLLAEEPHRTQQALRPQLVELFRSGVHLQPEFRRSDLAEKLWGMVSASASAEDLPGLVHQAAERAPLEEPLVKILCRAGGHAQPAVSHTAFECLANLPGRARRERSDLELSSQVFATGLARRDLQDDVVRSAIEAYAEYWIVHSRSRRRSFGWLQELRAHAPYLNDRLRSIFARHDPIRDPADWTEKSFAAANDLYDIYREMLDDDEPEQRRMACRALAMYPSPTAELVERLELQRHDPATSDLAPPR